MQLSDKKRVPTMPRARRKPAASRGRPKTTPRRRPPQLLVQGNGKLGPHLIWSFSIPAVTTCPGRSKLCELIACYAMKGHYRHHAVQAKYERNLRYAREESFVRDMSDEIRTWKMQVVRIHGSGDFYSREYTERWCDIARANPQTRFYFYTRSWRTAELLEQLLLLAAIPNVWGWFSCDVETGLPSFSKPADIRYAWMSMDDNQAQLIPPEVDLVFRVTRDTVAKKLGGIQVCPHEQGIIHVRGPITCDRCRICFRNPEKDQSCPTRTRQRSLPRP